MRTQRKVQRGNARLFGSVVAILVTAMLILGVASALAYEGPYCNPKNLGEGEFCPSSYVSNIRRAIGHSEGGDTAVEIITTVGSKKGACGSAGCHTETGYLSSDGSGNGYIENIGSGTHTYYGYLYP
jgi:hypothetical protein